jgi:hypothetical protein
MHLGSDILNRRELENLQQKTENVHEDIKLRQRRESKIKPSNKNRKTKYRNTDAEENLPLEEPPNENDTHEVPIRYYQPSLYVANLTLDKSNS